MNDQSRPPRDQPARRGSTPSRPGARRGRDLPRTVIGERRVRWGPGKRPLAGKVHRPISKGLSAPRPRGRWLTVGVPAVLGGVFGISSFIVLGVSSLVGGAGLLAPLLAGLGIGAVVGGGTGFLLRNRKPATVRLSRADAQMPVGTRTMLERTVRAATQQRRRIAEVRRRVRNPAVKPVLNRADSLLQRITSLVGSESLQSRRPSDGDVMILEGMASRYIPDLVNAVEDTAGFLASFTGGAREEALANLHSIDHQLAVLDEGIVRIEGGVVADATRSLDVHSEFLKKLFADRDPLIDR